MPTISLADIAHYFLVLGGTVFGGPLALIAHIRAELVDRRKWLSETEYQEGLAMATALPGPIAYQLGIYVGWLRRGWLGGLTAAWAFLLPPFCLCLLGALLYGRYRSSWIVTALFYGISPVVIALIVKAGYTLAKATFHSLLPWGIGIAAAAIVVCTRIDPTFLFLAAALFGILTERGQPIVKNNGGAIAIQLGLFFGKAACLLFGSGLVIIPMIQQYVVDQYHWLDTATFMDAVAFGMMTPGPVVITATFVGYLVAGFDGALASTIGMFFPSVLFIFLGAPLLQRHRHRPAVRGAIGGITPAVAGVIFASSIRLAHTALIDPLTWGIGLGALGCALRWKVPDLLLILIAGGFGVAIHAGRM